MHLILWLLVGALGLLTGCGPSQSDYAKLQAENAALKGANTTLLKEIDELKNGAERLSTEIERAYAEKDYTVAKQAIQRLASRHPESARNKEFAQLLATIELEERKEASRRVAQEKERLRLANLNNTGMWVIRHYVDGFGNETPKRYVTNKSKIVGKFSNSATEDSELLADILVNGKSQIEIMLYEYAGNNPVKDNGDTDYEVAVQDGEGGKYVYHAVNYSDRLTLKLENSADSLHRALLAGGTVKFRIKEGRGSNTLYAFEITPEGYENAMRLLSEPERGK